MKRSYLIAGLALLGGTGSLYAAHAVLLSSGIRGAGIAAPVLDQSPTSVGEKTASEPRRRVRVVLASPFGPETEVAPLARPAPRRWTPSAPAPSPSPPVALAVAQPQPDGDPAAAALAPMPAEPRVKAKKAKRVARRGGSNVIVVEAPRWDYGRQSQVYVGHTEIAR